MRSQLDVERQHALDWAWLCEALHAACLYSTLTTYTWAMSEGAYLQLLLLDTFHNDSRRVLGLTGIHQLNILMPTTIFSFTQRGPTVAW